MYMNIFSGNIMGTIASLFVVGGLIFGAGNIVNNHIDQAVQSNKPSIPATPPKLASPTIQPTLSPTVQGIQSTKKVVESDPIVNCNYPHTGSLPVRKSECAGTKIDCEVESVKWQVVWKTDCDAVYAKQGKGSNTQKAAKKPTTIATTPATYPTYTPYVPEKKITCTVSTGTYQVTQDLCDQFKVSDEKLLQGIADREETTFWKNIDSATEAYERCMNDAQEYYDQGMMFAEMQAQQYGSGSYPETSAISETQTQYNRLKQQCETNYPSL